MSKRKCVRFLLLVAAAVVLGGPAKAMAAGGSCGDAAAAIEVAVVRLAADRLDGVFGAAADSTRALGDTYARLAASTEASPAPQKWRARATTQGHTTGFRTWPGDRQAPPPFQAPYPGFYSYDGDSLSDAVLRQLALFEDLVPTFRAAYESFPFSWVYMTTADEVMMIYPYLPIGEAVHNDTPTKTVYYTAADFDRRRVGWTPPYLDLVGAGMMVTASYPVHDGDVLLGVMSRDITLKQLSASVLSHLTAVPGSTALIVTGQGVAIDASDPKLAAEIDRTNAKTGTAVLYYRTAEGLKSLQDKDAVASQSPTTNARVERVLAEAGPKMDVVRLDHDDRCVLAAPIERTGWLVILTLPAGAS